MDRLGTARDRLGTVQGAGRAKGRPLLSPLSLWLLLLLLMLSM